MNEKTNLKEVVFENNGKLKGICEILSNVILEGNTRGDTLYCIISILQDVIKSQTV